VIVIDAAAFVDAVDGRRRVIDRLMNEDIHAPHFIDIEVVSALRRLVAADRFDPQRAMDALSILEQGDIRRHPHTPLLRVAWSLRGRISAYDAAYVALAAALAAPLVTTDRKLASLSGLPCVVEVL
jgi:predicted nucleic acid-binding protein